jgi:hypothetical protein
MEYDEDKVDEMILALLHLTTFREGMACAPGKDITGAPWSAFTREDTIPTLRARQSP